MDSADSAAEELVGPFFGRVTLAALLPFLKNRLNVFFRCANAFANALVSVRVVWFVVSGITYSSIQAYVERFCLRFPAFEVFNLPVGLLIVSLVGLLIVSLLRMVAYRVSTVGSTAMK